MSRPFLVKLKGPGNESGANASTLFIFYPDSLGQFYFIICAVNQHSSILLTFTPSTLSGLMTAALDLT